VTPFLVEGLIQRPEQTEIRILLKAQSFEKTWQLNLFDQPVIRF
jgi:hypothetical protein